MIRIAIVPYRNDGGNYHIISPFDSTYATNSYSLSSCLLSYTGKSDPNATGTYTATVSGFVLVTAQAMSMRPTSTMQSIQLVH